MSYREELAYLGKCCGVSSVTVTEICDSVESVNPFRDDDSKFEEAARIFWALVH